MNRSGNIPAVELRGITKTFPGVVANDAVDLELYRGEIHCLLGENGAGKSTLMQILSGMHRPDAGTIAVDGTVVEVGSPKKAIALGVGMVYQHPTLVPTFTVLENLLLGSKGGLRLDRQEATALLSAAAARLGTEVDPEAVVGRMALGRQQLVEIIKALWSGAAILILDEPTAMLTPREVTSLASALVSLKGQDLAVVFITHKLREALMIGDRITVLRQGRVVGRLTPQHLRSATPESLQTEIVTMMFGEEAAVVREVAELGRGGPKERRARDLSPEVVLRADAVSVKPGRDEVGVDDVTFSVRKGEIFGIAGIDGNGQRELAEALAGQRRLARGRVWFAGEDVTHASVHHRQQLGLRFVTDDRLGEGTVPSLPISLNLLLKRIGEQPFWSKARRISAKLVARIAEDLAGEFDIRAPNVHTPSAALSGGNVQKMVLARELSFHPKVVIYSKPTHGLDVKTTVDIRRRVRDLSGAGGVSAVLMSTDLDELIDLCDRIGVMSRGRLVGIVDNYGPGIVEKVGALMVGSGEEEH